MSYEKQNWKNGDVITETKLNHMEDGIASGGGVLVVNEVYDEQTETISLDHTWKEIHDADFAVLKMINENDVSTCILSECYSGAGYNVIFRNMVSISDTYGYATDSQDGYPVATEG